MPRKAASFMVAGQVFKNRPRYQPYGTESEDADRFGNAAFSFPRDLSAYVDQEVLIHTGDVNGELIKLPVLPKRIVGYGSSPYVRYGGQGLYLLEAVAENDVPADLWTLKVMPHAVFKEDLKEGGENSPGGVVVSRAKGVPMTVRVPGGEQTKWDVYRLEDGRRTRVETSDPGITFLASPGEYEIVGR